MSLATRRIAGLAAIALVAVTYQQQDHVIAHVEQNVSVTGRSDNVADFLQAQAARRASLRVTKVEPAGADRARAMIALPGAYTGADLIRTAREALDAGLSYSIEGRSAALSIRF